jgi:hypothetical protein
MAFVIALSLPGASKLAPYIHSISAGQTGVNPTVPLGDPPGSSRRKSILKTAPRPSAASRPSTFRFLQPVPDIFDDNQHPESNILLSVNHGVDHDIFDSPGTLPTSGTPERTRTGVQSGTPDSAATQNTRPRGPDYVKPLQSSAGVQPGMIADPASKTVDRLKIGFASAPRTAATVGLSMVGEEVDALSPIEDLVLYRTSTGFVQRASRSIAEVEMRDIMMDLGPQRTQGSPVYRALAGTFGRLQQSEHEAFLHMRTVRLRDNNVQFLLFIARLKDFCIAVVIAVYF